MHPKIVVFTITIGVLPGTYYLFHVPFSMFHFGPTVKVEDRHYFKVLHAIILF